MAPNARASLRQRSLGAIHAGRRALGLDDDTYRDYLAQLTGKRSAADCSDAELSRVLDDMRTRGFQRKDGEQPMSSLRATQLDKARAIWRELGEIGELRAPTEAAFCAYVERMTKRSRPEWCSVAQLVLVIEGLKKWRDRATSARRPSTTIE